MCSKPTHDEVQKITRSEEYRQAVAKVEQQIDAQQKDRITPVDHTILPGTECILFFDDEPMLVQLAQKMLTQYGYTVVGRSSSTDALELFRHAPDQFDVVVTDQTMPHMTGTDLANETLKLRPDTPIIVCTGYSAIILPTIAKGMGIREVVMKPLIMADLARIIRKVCDQPHSISNA